jgi:hypothetical protein
MWIPWWGKKIDLAWIKCEIQSKFWNDFSFGMYWSRIHVDPMPWKEIGLAWIKCVIQSKYWNDFSFGMYWPRTHVDPIVGKENRFGMDQM